MTAAHVDDRLYGKTPGCPKCNAIARGAKTTYSHNQECRDRILARVREDDSERAQDYDARHIRRAMQTQDAQTQAQAPADDNADSATPDARPMDDSTRTRPREPDLPLQGGVMPSEQTDATEPLTKKKMTAAEKSRRCESAGHMKYVPTPERQKRPADTPIEQHEHDITQVQTPDPPVPPMPDFLPLP